MNAGLRALGLKSRLMYACRHTSVSEALSAGCSPKWVSEYVGTDLATLERHYARYMSTGSDELAKLARTGYPGGESSRSAKSSACATRARRG